MIGELGRLSEIGTRDPADMIRPYVEMILSLRDEARNRKAFDVADSMRQRLESLGVTVHDTANGSGWELRPQHGNG